MQKRTTGSNTGRDGSNDQAYTGISTAITSLDRIDAIVKDLSPDSYSFSFDKAMPGAGVTKTAYGANNYLVYADPQDVICPDPIRFRCKKIAIWKRPNFIQPTCPDMAMDVNKLTLVQDIIAKADPAQYGALRGI